MGDVIRTTDLEEIRNLLRKGDDIALPLERVSERAVAFYRRLAAETDEARPLLAGEQVTH